MNNLKHLQTLISEKNLPKGWAYNDTPHDLFIPEVNTLFPNAQKITPILRGSTNATFMIERDRNFQVCQFSPSLSSSNRSNFSNIKKRIDYLKKNGIAVPNIISNGHARIDNQKREYIIMDYINGISADIFLDKNPQKSPDLYNKMGNVLARLHKVPAKEARIPANKIVLNRIRTDNKYLLERLVFTPKQIDQIYNNVEKRLLLLGHTQASYVHLDPFPVNIQASDITNDFHITLMDIRSIDLGHPLVEGLGRAIKWGVYYWDYLSVNKYKNTKELVDSLLYGYSDILPEARKFIESSEQLKLLLDTAEIVGLPKMLAKESKKIKREEYYEWSVKRLIELVNIHI